MPLSQPPPIGSLVFTHNNANGNMAPGMVTGWVAGAKWSNIHLAQFSPNGTINYLLNIPYSATGLSGQTKGFVYNMAGPAGATPRPGQVVLYRDPTRDAGFYQGFRRAAMVLRSPASNGGAAKLMLLSPTTGQGNVVDGIASGPTNSFDPHYEIDRRMLEGTGVTYYEGNGGPPRPALIVHLPQNTQPTISFANLFVFFPYQHRLTPLIQPGGQNTNGVAQYAR